MHNAHECAQGTNAPKIEQQYIYNPLYMEKFLDGGSGLALQEG